MLNVGGILRTAVELRAWRMKGRGQGLGDYLFRLDIVRNIALNVLVQEGNHDPAKFLTRSFAPRLRKRAPAK